MTRGERIVAARYLRTLATVEKLSALGNDREVERLLAGIDPLEAAELAIALDDENADLMGVWRETLAPSAEVIPLPGGYAAVYPQVKHAGDNWSRKVGA